MNRKINTNIALRMNWLSSSRSTDGKEMNSGNIKVLLIFLILSLTGNLIAGGSDDITLSGETEAKEQITIIRQLPVTPVRDQYKTSTCWSFSTISLLESELLRTGRGEYDLSEMFIVHQNYIRKAKKYVRMHGKINFAPGGESNDVVDIIASYGIVPEDIYSGLKVDSEKHIHSEMDKVLEEYVDAVVTNPDNKLSDVWEDGFKKVLDSYLGEMPESFNYKGENYTPSSFYDQLGIDPDDYIMITSFIHVPFYQPFILEIPDNWSWEESYNVPLDELTQIMDSALYSGYSVAWAADVSEEGFNFKKGFAVVPKIIYGSYSEREMEKWSEKTTEEKEEIMFNMKKPVKELEVTPENRQKAFDNYSTTDDHGMHIVGIARDKNARKFYYVKNSWGIDNPFNGYLFVSDAYFRYKTISVMLHKEAIPMNIAKKLNL
ncbi:MAG: C1 family peptidase [Bacteroidales bacterium]|jgi:bleomycin hydrolase